MFRFLHTSDLHLGRTFGGFEEDVRGRLREARTSVLDRLAEAARAGGAETILLAGDSFDQETPAPRLIRQALNAMRAAPDLTWVLMPGNHDSLAATELWRTMAQDAPDNVTLALETTPIDLGGATLLPAPPTTRNPGRDLTEAMQQATPDGVLRIGLGHGGITDFASMGTAAAEGPSGVIAPDRARRAGLDYLGLGDWHGQIRIDARSWYSGTPEPDSFKHDHQGTALLVALSGQGAVPEVSPVATAALHWQRAKVDLTPQEDIDALLSGLLPPLEARRDRLFDLRARGRLGVRQMQALQDVCARVAPDFLQFAADLGDVQLAHEAADIDAIDTSGGALRKAAERLAARGGDPALSEEDRRVAQNALSYLFGFAAGESDT